MADNGAATSDTGAAAAAASGIVRKAVRRRWFELIVAGKKVVEGRIACGFWARDSLTAGTVFELESEGQVQLLRVASVKPYASFRELLEKETLPRVLPGVTDLEEGVAVYREFYPAELEAEHGVVAVEVALVAAAS